MRFTEQLPSKYIRDTHTGTESDEGGQLMKYAETVSGTTIYARSFINLGSGIQNLIERGGGQFTETLSAWGSYARLHLVT
jgi:hypothetical protein